MQPVFVSRFVRAAFPWLAALWLVVAAATPARAWNGPGHMMVAAIAYDQLTPAQREHVTAILAAHPDFAKWKDAAPKDVPGFDFGRYYFMRAATWPDDIRKSGSSYDHPIWHYVDFPLKPPGFPLEMEPTGTEDILTASAYCEKMITDPGSSPVDRAAYLSWLIHLIGDVMQPLHTVTLVTAEYPAPAGDKGGNAFFVDLAGNPINLHSYWDGLGGLMLDTHEIIAHAADLEKKYPRATLPELESARDMRAWALEGRQIAIDSVYLKGTLPGANKPLPVLPPLPGNYAANSRVLAGRRIALAGYRLADTLTRLKL